MSTGKTQSSFTIAFLLLAASLPLQAQDLDQERTVYIRVTCEGGSPACTQQAREQAAELISATMKRIPHFRFRKANANPAKDLCGTLEINVAKYPNLPWTATVEVYRYLRTCNAKPESIGLPLIEDVPASMGKAPTEYNFPALLNNAVIRYVTLKHTQIEETLWKAIPLVFHAQLNADNAELLVKFFKVLDGNPSLFAGAMYDMKDLDPGAGAWFRLKGYDCTPQDPNLLVRARPKEVIEDPPDGKHRDYVDRDSAILRAMTNNVIYMFKPGDIQECGEGNVAPSGFNSTNPPAKTTASAK